MESNSESQIKIENEKNVTLEFIINEMNTIWKEFKKSNIFNKPYETTELRYKAIDENYDRVTSAHKELLQAYPTVLRHMLQDGRYHPEAFSKYLKRLSVRPWKSDEERMDSYADYYIILYKQMNNKYDNKLVKEEKKRYRQILQDEHDKFIELHKEWKEKIDKQEEKYEKERYDEMVTAFERLANEKNLPEEQLDKVKKLVRDDKLSYKMLELLTTELMLSNSDK